MHKLQQAHQENAAPRALPDLAETALPSASRPPGDHVPKGEKLTLEHNDEKQALVIIGVGVIIGIIWFFKR